MKISKNIFHIIWRAWFYGWVFFTIFFAFPILIVLISREKYYTKFFKVAIAWAKTILFVMGFYKEVKYEQKIVKGKSYMYSANHTSMIDIMLMLAVMKNPAVFVGKVELTKIPLFGFVFKRTSIVVDRGNTKSRKEVYDQAQRKLNMGLSICIFPEGLVPDDESVVLSDFKNGAFRLAIEHQISIIPMTFYDCKERFSYTFFSGSPGKLRVKVHPFIKTEGLILKDKNSIKKQTFDIIYNELSTDLKLQQIST